MPVPTSLYHAAKRAIGALPPWMLRVRPFVVYQIPLASTDRDEVEPPASNVAASGPAAVEVRWVADHAEAASLQPLASARCVAEFDGATRRVAAAWIDGRPVGCAWVATGSFTETDLGLRFELAADEAWLFAAAVAPACRNRGVYRQLLDYLVADLRRVGLRRLLLGVTAGNEPSRRAHARQGAIAAGRVLAARILGRPFCHIKGQIERSALPTAAGRGVVHLTVER